MQSTWDFFDDRWRWTRRMYLEQANAQSGSASTAQQCNECSNLIWMTPLPITRPGVASTDCKRATSERQKTDQEAWNIVLAGCSNDALRRGFGLIITYHISLPRPDKLMKPSLPDNAVARWALLLFNREPDSTHVLGRKYAQVRTCSAVTYLKLSCAN